MDDLLKELGGIKHRVICLSHYEDSKTEHDWNKYCRRPECISHCPACAVLKAKPLLIAEGKRQMIKDYYCEHCSTPGFAHIIIPIKVYEALTGDK